MKNRMNVIMSLWVLSIAALFGILIINSIDFDKVDAIPIDVNNTYKANYSYDRDEVFRLAVSSVISPVETVKGYQPLIEYMEQKLGKRVELVQRKTYREVNDLIEAGEIDLGFICTLSYVEAERQFGAKLLAVPQVRGSTMYRSVTIVRKESDINSIHDLQGVRFAFTDPMSFSGRAAMIGELAKIDKTPENTFGSVIFTFSHDNSLRAVYEGVVDAACMDSIVFAYTEFLYPEITDQLRIIHSSPSVGNPPVVMGPKATDEEIQIILDILLNMHLNEQGKKALDALMFDKFVAGDNHSYQYIRDLLNKVQVDYNVK